MNYKRIYDSIIENAKNQIREGYLEKHHIVPKSVGGSDDKSNLVLLTAREHYLCHWLLAKHTNDKRMWLAFSMMCVSSNKHQRITNGRMFEQSKIARTFAMSGENNPMFGKKSFCKQHSEETKEKIRLSKLGKKRTPFSRKPASDDTKDKISKSKTGIPSKLKGVPMKKRECPYCHQMISIGGNYTRWHGDNCKSK